MTAPTPTLIFLSDCTPLYTTLGAPARIASVSTFPLNKSIRLEWSLPPNSDEVLVESYIVRYGKYGAPSNIIIDTFTVFFPTFIVPNLENGVLYSFWVSAKNRFGESPLSSTVSSSAGSTPTPIKIVRRSYHASPLKVGIEFTPPINNNGKAPFIFTIKYQNLVQTDISYTQIESVQTYEEIKDASNNTPLNANGVKGNFIRKEVTIPVGVSLVSGRYRFTVSSSNLYGTSPVSDTYFDVDLPLASSVIAPSFAYRPPISPAPSSGLPNGDIYSITPLNTAFRFRWYKYIDTSNNAPAPTYAGWVYRIQYTDNKDYWYYPTSGAVVTCYPEYTVPYNAVTDASGIYTLDISACVVNGRRYYVRYCVVDANGDTSPYTQITDTNLDKTSVIPGKPPNPPPIFFASVDDRLVRLYFNWTVELNPITNPPSLDLTGGYPIIDYRIDRFKVTRDNGVYNEQFEISFNNLIGPYYEDTYDLRENGGEFKYYVYTRTNFGYSTGFTTVTAIPSRRSDIVNNVVASVGNNQITLEWSEPADIDDEMPITQYYIEYLIYDIYNVNDISTNIVGELTSTTTIGNTIQDMNSILVNDTLWDKFSVEPSKKFTNSLNRSFTITDLINNKPYIFRVAAVTVDRLRRKMIGLLQVIDDASPYLQHPIIIGLVPSRLTNVVFTNLSTQIQIVWNSSDISNSQNIIRFHVDYRIFGSVSGTPYLRQSFDYFNSLLYKDATTAYFSVTVVGLDNNISQNPATNSDSYEILLFAENFVGFTNTSDKVKLHELRNVVDVPISLKTTYENIMFNKNVRPMTIPNVIVEQR